MYIGSRTGWKVCPLGTKFAVAGTYHDNRVGNAIAIVDTADEAQRMIDTGRADELEINARRQPRVARRAH